MFGALYVSAWFFFHTFEGSMYPCLTPLLPGQKVFSPDRNMQDGVITIIMANVYSRGSFPRVQMNTQTHRVAVRFNTISGLEQITLPTKATAN